MFVQTIFPILLLFLVCPSLADEVGTVYFHTSVSCDHIRERGMYYYRLYFFKNGDDDNRLTNDFEGELPARGKANFTLQATVRGPLGSEYSVGASITQNCRVSRRMMYPTIYYRGKCRIGPSPCHVYPIINFTNLIMTHTHDVRIEQANYRRRNLLRSLLLDNFN